MYEKAEVIRVTQGMEAAMEYIETIDDVNVLDRFGLDEMSDVLYVYELLGQIQAGQLQDFFFELGNTTQSLLNKNLEAMRSQFYITLGED
ncbi:MAG: hypothetical protein SH856_12500 [Flavobacteriales bacterium]|nr:hypothetical protein [Flavobacteriales bacterium]